MSSYVTLSHTNLTVFQNELTVKFNGYTVSIDFGIVYVGANNNWYLKILYIYLSWNIEKFEGLKKYGPYPEYIYNKQTLLTFK